jgi:hypothetical protein
LRKGRASDAPDSRSENPSGKPVDTAVPSHTDAASSHLWAESSHHRLTHRIAGPLCNSLRQKHEPRKGRSLPTAEVSSHARPMEERDHGLRRHDRGLGVLARDASAVVHDPVTALHVGLIVAPPLRLLRRRITRELVERAANRFIIEVRSWSGATKPIGASPNSAARRSRMSRRYTSQAVWASTTTHSKCDSSSGHASPLA